MIGRATTIAALALVAGCAAMPDVAYHQLGPGPHHDTWMPFRLTDSIVVIGAPGAARADGNPAAPVDLTRKTVRCPGAVCDPVAIAAVPTDFRGALYAMEPRSKRLVSTTAAPTYVANSLRLKTLTIEAKDHRLEAINAVATVAAGIVHLTEKGADLFNDDVTDRTARLLLPVALTLADLPCDPAATACTGRIDTAIRRLPNNPKWTYTIAFRDDPAAQGLLPRQQIDTVHAAMIAAACRPVRLTLYQADQNATVVLDIDVADPDWLVTVPFPAKGALTFHSLCGVDVEAQPVTAVGVDAMATAFVNGVQQVAKQK